MQRSEYKPGIEGSTAKYDEGIEKGTMNLFGYRGLLLHVAKGPSSSKITQQSKYQQLYWRRHLVVDFLTTPTSKMGIVSNPL
jgi:hypothetical protein